MEGKDAGSGLTPSHASEDRRSTQLADMREASKGFIDGLCPIQDMRKTFASNRHIGASKI